MHASTLPLLIDSDAVLGNASPRQMVDALASGHLRRDVSTTRMYSPIVREARADAEVLTWLGSRTDGRMGMKFVTVSADNPERMGSGVDTIHSAFVLCDADDAHLQCFIVGNSFTRYKTAADSALGARFLAPTRPTRLLMIGAGSQAPVHLQVICAEFPSLERVDVWNRDSARAERLAEQMQLKLPAEVRASASLERSAGEADIVSCVTRAAEPVLKGAWLKPGTHVDLVGGYTPQMREADDDVVRNARLFVDHRALVMEHCGDVVQPLARGVIDASHIVGDLFDLCGKTVEGRRSDSEITVFKNGGGGHLDLMFAEWIYALQCATQSATQR